MIRQLRFSRWHHHLPNLYSSRWAPRDATKQHKMLRAERISGLLGWGERGDTRCLTACMRSLVSPREFSTLARFLASSTKNSTPPRLLRAFSLFLVLLHTCHRSRKRGPPDAERKNLKKGGQLAGGSQDDLKRIRLHLFAKRRENVSRHSPRTGLLTAFFHHVLILGESTDDATTNPHSRQVQTPDQSLWTLPGGLYPRRPGALSRFAVRSVQLSVYTRGTAPDHRE